MWTSCTNLLAIAVSSASSAFLRVTGAIPGALGAIFGVFVLCTAVRLLLGPLIGTASSDTVRTYYGGTKLGRHNSAKRDDQRTSYATSKRGRDNAQARFDARPRRG